MSEHLTETDDDPANLTVVFVALLGLAMLCVCVGGILIGIVMLAEGA